MKNYHLLSRFIDVLIIISAFVLTNSTAFAVIGQFPNFLDSRDPAWSVVILCIVVLFLLVFQIKLLSLGNSYKNVWKNQLPLILFGTFCLCSIFWSSYRLASVYELIMMIFASLLGVFLVVRYSPETDLDILFYFGVFSVVASFLYLTIAPTLARLENVEFQGAWRGIFWHRNHMGSLMAFFSSIFLLRAAMAFTTRKSGKSLICLIFFILSAILVFGSRSATGIILVFILNGMLALIFLWLRFRHLLEKKHYVIMAALTGLVLVFALSNLNSIFGLLGRSSTLTGRIPIWNDLLSRVWPQKPILGFGFGALWNDETFRISMQMRHGWPYQVYFSDNGYLDILLNTGLFGLILFLIFFVVTGWYCCKVFLKNPNYLSLLPLLLFVYVFWANISYSFLLEVDQFVWMLLILAASLSRKFLGSKNIPYTRTNNPQP